MLLEALLNNLMANTENAINKPNPEITNIVKYGYNVSIIFE